MIELMTDDPEKARVAYRKFLSLSQKHRANTAAT